MDRRDEDGTRNNRKIQDIADRSPEARKGRHGLMTFLEFVLLLLVAGLCGSIGQAITGYSHGGCLVSIAIGFIGALIGAWISRQLTLPDIFVLELGGRGFPIIWSIIGSALFVALISMLSRHDRKRH